MIFDIFLSKKFKSPCHVIFYNHPSCTCKMLPSDWSACRGDTQPQPVLSINTKNMFLTVEWQIRLHQNPQWSVLTWYQILEWSENIYFLMFQAWSKQTHSGAAQLIWGHVFWSFKFYNHVNINKHRRRDFHGTGIKIASSVPVGCVKMLMTSLVSSANWSGVDSILNKKYSESPRMQAVMCN